MSPTIATIVPKTLTKYSYQKRVNKALNLILEIDLPKNSFILDGKPKDVPSVFQIWSIYGSCKRASKPEEVHNKDWFWDNNNPTHYCIAASRKIISIDDVNKNHRGYKLSSKLDTAVLQDRFNNVPWEGTSSVSGGVFSLPKNEISKQYRDHKQP